MLVEWIVKVKVREKDPQSYTVMLNLIFSNSLMFFGTLRSKVANT